MASDRCVGHSDTVTEAPDTSALVPCTFALANCSFPLYSAAKYAPSVPRIVLLSGPRAGSEVSVRSDGLSVGRDENGVLSISDPLLSRRHYAISSLGSLGYSQMPHADFSGSILR
jgi:hypothetical protein